MRNFILTILVITTLISTSCSGSINREALIRRNCPIVTEFDSLSSLSVGNGKFAFTVDASGLQTFPDLYKSGVPLGTQSQWGWHSFPNTQNYKAEEALKEYNFGHGHKEIYSIEFKEGRQKAASDWLRANPHRLHLGVIGLEMEGAPLKKEQFKNIHQKLDLYTGEITSRYDLNGKLTQIQTVCHSSRDLIAAHIISEVRPSIGFRFAYPTGKHTDDACNWNADSKHSTVIVNQETHSVLLKRIIDKTIYYVKIQWEGNARFSMIKKNHFILTPLTDDYSFSCEFLQNKSNTKLPDFLETEADALASWHRYWNDGAAVDFSGCKDPRAKELERRVVLSQYLLAIQCAENFPPQETGLTYNSWFGKPHLEMIWWHEAQFALWGHPELLAKTLKWYKIAYPKAKEIAKRQGFKGVRWMKMTDPSADESPSSIGSFLIWQQPHIIYLAELLYRCNPSKDLLKQYGEMIDQTAEFMADFATYDKAQKRYILKGCIPAQETLKPDSTINPPFELSYWHFALETAQKWREREGKPRNAQWDKVIKGLSPLAANKQGLYLAAESATNTYTDRRFTSDHMAVLGAEGVFPASRLVKEDLMKNTLNWVWKNWNWNQTWGWDYPMTAMCATRLGEPEKAIGALLMDKRTNTYLINGHNYQDNRLRIYLPGNGGLLTAVALMCAGWDGCDKKNPGFPDNGQWNVKWEGLKLLP